MAKLPKLLVELNDGEPAIEVQITSRDALALERDSVDISASGSVAGSYMLTYMALCRLQRAGTLNGRVIPETLDAFMDLADFTPVDDEDAEGKDSVPVPTTG